MAAVSIEPFILAQRPNEANETALTVFGYEHAVPKVRGDVALQQVLLHAVEGQVLKGRLCSTGKIK